MRRHLASLSSGHNDCCRLWIDSKLAQVVLRATHLSHTLGQPLQSMSLNCSYTEAYVHELRQGQKATRELHVCQRQVH